MSSRDTTPEVSPIRSALRCRDDFEDIRESVDDDLEMAEVQEDELEDGEISDETGQDNLSTISEDELNSSGHLLTASTNHNHEMYEDLNDVTSPIFDQENLQAETGSTNSTDQPDFENAPDNFESPESPDMDAVTGSPVKLIPVIENIESPVRSSQDSSCSSPASEREYMSTENEKASESEGVESEEDDDDIDEDILYLRLIALRSLAADAEAEEKKNKENQLELEMQQLLQEAQDAAEEARTGEPATEEAVNSRAASKEAGSDNTNITKKSTNVESSKNEKTDIVVGSKKFGVKELSENRNIEDNSKQNSGKESRKVEDDTDDITLIQVLINKERKRNLTVIDLVSPPLSPKQDEGIDLTNEDENASVPEDIPLPSLPPLPEQNVAAPPPPPPPRTPPPLPPPAPSTNNDSMTGMSSSQSVIPPPPGEGASNCLNTQPYPPASNQNWHSILQPPVCTSGSFFNSQAQDVTFGRPIQGVNNQHQGPTPWQIAGQYPVPYSFGEGFNAGQMPPHLERPEYSDVAHFLSAVNNYTYQDWNQPEVVPPPPPSTADENKKIETQESLTYDDFAPTVIYSNNKTLTSRKRTRTRQKSKGPKRRKLSSNSFTEDDEESLRALLLNQIIDKVQKKDPTSIDEPMEVEPTALVDEPIQIKVVKDVESVKVKKQLEKPKAIPKEIPVKLKQVTKPILSTKRKPTNVKKLTNTAMLKHFPNMTKKMIIPLNETDSDDDDIIDTNLNTEQPAHQISFQSNLDQFLKGIRSTKTTSTKLNSSNPEKRKRLSMQLKAMYNKKDSAKSDISNLPLSKQIEYLHLKQLIAKKEGKLKKKTESVKTPITNKVKASSTSNVAKSTVVNKTTALAVAKKAVVKVTPVTKKASISNSAATKKSATTVAQIPNTAVTKKVTQTTNVKKAEVKVAQSTIIPKKVTDKTPVANTSENKTRTSPEVTIVGMKAGGSVNQVDDSNVANKTEEDDEDILREMLLKEMQDKAKITVNLDGDQRKVRVKKYNLTPNFKKKTETVVKLVTDNKEQNSSRLSRIDQNIAKSNKNQDSKMESKEESVSKVPGLITDQAKPTTSSISSKTSSSILTFQSRSVPNSPGKTRSPDTRVQTRPKSGSPLSRSMPSSPTQMLRSNSPSQVKDDVLKTSNSNVESKTENLVKSEKSASSLFVVKSTGNPTASSKPTSSDDKLETEKNKANELKSKKLTNPSISTTAASKGEPVKGQVKVTTLKKVKAKIPDPRVKRLKQPIKPVTKDVGKAAAQSTKVQVKPVPNKEVKKINSEKEKELKPLANASKEMIVELKKEENIVIKKRSGLTTALYRMSAQISQLEKWGADLESAKTLKEKLMKELNQVAKIISQREAGIHKTKTEIKDSHIKVNQLREEMENSEVRCEALGGQVYGPATYTCTDKGAAEYRNERICWA